MEQSVDILVAEHARQPLPIRGRSLSGNLNASQGGVIEAIGPSRASGRPLKRVLRVEDDHDRFRGEMAELLSNLSISFFKNLQNRDPGTLVFLTVELHDKVRAASCGHAGFNRLSAANL